MTACSTDALVIQGVEIRRVVEWVGPIKTVDEMFPDTPDNLWTQSLAPQFWTPETRAYRAAIQTWVLKSEGRTIVIDTGVGNSKDRPQVPTLAGLRTPFLTHLAEAGVEPADVDLVINTHIHYDHVGWNTTLVDGRWVPTFPNATYLVPQADYDYFRPENSEEMRAPRTEDEQARFEGIRLVFADSIEPVAAAGQLQTWTEHHQIDHQLRLAPTPGHTPGSSVVWLGGDAGAVFVGDLVHTPIQIDRPEDSCAFDLDTDQARDSRHALLRDAGKFNATLFPAHFAGPGAARLITDSAKQPHVGEWVSLPGV